MRRVDELIDYLRGCDSLDIVCHDSPDPDAIASAATLEWIAENSGVSNVRILYGGQISHHQNRAMIQHFGLELVPITTGDPLSAERVAFVDHAIPGEHTQLPPEIDVDIVIDHHRCREPIPADFVDLRPTFGATSTIMTEYLSDVIEPPPVDLASMLLFALHRERLDHMRNPTRREYEAALLLVPNASQSIINHLYEAQFTPEMLNVMGEAIRNRVVRGSSLVSWVGRISQREALSQSANYLINLEDVDIDLVMGLIDDEIHLSARSQDPEVPLDTVIREVVGPDGRAGGHKDMAGGVIPVDPSLARQQNPSAFAEQFVEPVVEPVVERFFDAFE